MTINNISEEIETTGDDVIENETDTDVTPERSASDPIKPKRGRGRPPGTGKPAISELPPPSSFNFAKADKFFGYLNSVPKDKLTRVTLTFYRYHPIIDMTEGGKRQANKYIDVIAGESHPFGSGDWEQAMLHLYGSGTYGCYLNENNKPVCRCLKIETRWSPEEYPPVIDPATLDESHPSNKTYIQFLRQKGIKLPSQINQEELHSEMQLADTINKLTDTVIAQSARQNVPLPPPVPTMAEKLSFETAMAGVDMLKEKMKADIQAGTQQANGLELVDKVLSVADRMKGDGGGSSDFIKLMMQQQADDRRRAEAAEERHSRLLEKLIETKPQSETEGISKTLALLTQMKEFMNDGKSSRADDDEESNPAKPAGIGAMLVQNLPQILQVGLGIFGQFNQSMAMMTRMKELEAARANGTPVQPMMQPQGQPIPMPQANGGVNGMPADAAAPMQPQETNPATGQVLTPEELAERRAAQIKYAPFHSLLASLAGPMLNHMNDPDKDGYDFASWFIEGNGNLMYEQIRGVGEQELMNAIRSYAPLWQTIGGNEEKVQEFVHEFLHVEDAPMDAEEEEATV